jgi:hypothetical protein
MQELGGQPEINWARYGGEKNAAFNGFTAGTGFLAQGGGPIPPFDEGPEWGDPQPVPFDFSPYDEPYADPYKPKIHNTPWEQQWFPNTANPNFYAVQNPQDINPHMWSAGSRIDAPTNEKYGLLNRDVPRTRKSKINKFDLTIHNPVTQQSPFNIPSKNAQVGDASYPNYVQRPEEMTPTITPQQYTPGMYDQQQPQRVPEKTNDVTQQAHIGRKNWKDRWWADPDIINAGMEGVTNIANWSDRQKKEKWLRQQTSADNLFASQRGSRGKYTPNGGIFDPYNMTPVEQAGAAGFQSAQYGGSQELYMTDDEIEQIKRDGGEVEFLD